MTSSRLTSLRFIPLGRVWSSRRLRFVVSVVLRSILRWRSFRQKIPTLLELCRLPTKRYVRLLRRYSRSLTSSRPHLPYSWLIDLFGCHPVCPWSPPIHVTFWVYFYVSHVAGVVPALCTVCLVSFSMDSGVPPQWFPDLFSRQWSLTVNEVKRCMSHTVLLKERHTYIFRVKTPIGVVIVPISTADLSNTISRLDPLTRIVDPPQFTPSSELPSPTSPSQG